VYQRGKQGVHGTISPRNHQQITAGLTEVGDKRERIVRRARYLHLPIGTERRKCALPVHAPRFASACEGVNQKQNFFAFHAHPLRPLSYPF